jgi:hypothetical protein
VQRNGGYDLLISEFSFMSGEVVVVPAVGDSLGNFSQITPTNVCSVRRPPIDGSAHLRSLAVQLAQHADLPVEQAVRAL